MKRLKFDTTTKMTYEPLHDAFIAQKWLVYGDQVVDVYKALLDSEQYIYMILSISIIFNHLALTDTLFTTYYYMDTMMRNKHSGHTHILAIWSNKS